MLPYDPMMIYKFEGDKTPSMSTWLRYAVRQTGITQQELAGRLEVSPNNFSMWMHGRQKFPPKHFFKLAKVFNVDPLYIRNIINYEYFQDREMYDIDEAIRELGSLTRNEYEIIKLMRQHGGNPRITNDDQKRMFSLFLSTLDKQDPDAGEVQPRQRKMSVKEKKNLE